MVLAYYIFDTKNIEKERIQFYTLNRFPITEIDI